MVLPIAEGDHGWPVYALQRAIGFKPASGDFGPATKRKVKGWQKDHGLKADGVAGPLTQGTILQLAGITSDREHDLPEGVGYGFAVAEGAGVLAATNWQVAGGVDCGPAQWRIKGPPFNMNQLLAAFRPYQAVDRACKVLAERRKDFRRRNSHFTVDEALRVGVLYHHWPAGAERIVDKYSGGGEWWRYVPGPDEPATWITIDGKHPTKAEWSAEYPKRILRFVAT